MKTMRGRILGTTVVATMVVAGSSHAQGDAASALPELPWHASAAYASGGSRDYLSVIRAAEAELTLGRPEQAIAILSENAVPDSLYHGAAIRVVANALYQLGRYPEASNSFARAATVSSGDSIGVMTIRAAESFERSNMAGAASRLYEVAARQLPTIAGWLALRHARVDGDTATARRLLVNAPPQARRLANLVWADIAEAAGDTVNAITAFVDAGELAHAAELSLAVGDSAVSRRLAYQGLRSGSREQASRSATLLLENFPPTTTADIRLVARVLQSTGRPREAADLLREAVSEGDSSAATLYQYGRATQAARDHWRALGVYQAAANMGGEDAVNAQFERASLLVSMRRRIDALRALRAFVIDQPAHRNTPLAFYLMGDLEQDAGRLGLADSLYEIVVNTWPRSETAGRARLRLGSNAMLRGDTVDAIVHFSNASVQDGEQARSSRFQLGVLHRARGDDGSAQAAWQRLAREDSLGYYGTIARIAAGLPSPVFESPSRPVQSPRVARELAALDLLDAAGLNEEAGALIQDLTSDRDYTVAEGLDIGEGLIARGRTIQGIRLGWRLAESLTTNHPRVVRLIFPWPNRELVEREAARFDLDPILVASLIRQESAFDARIVSQAGASGLMQLMPSTARGVARELGVEWSADLLVVADANVHVGTAHLASLMEKYDGDVIASLAAYNAGSTPVGRWLKFPEAADPVQFVERIPYRETRGYVKSVLRNRHLYAALYGQNAVP